MFKINFGVFGSNVFLTLKTDDLFLTKNIHPYIVNIMDA
jgi:hypothetical protein